MRVNGPVSSAAFSAEAGVSASDGPFCRLHGVWLLGAICNACVESVKRHFN